MRRVTVKYNIAILLLTILVLTACGIKGNPVILLHDNSLTEEYIKAFSSNDGVTLTWNYSDEDKKIKYVAVEKSEAGSAGNECEGCPRKFEHVAEVPVRKYSQNNIESQIFRFTDKKVVRGKTYTYRLMLCVESGICSEGCTTEVKYK